MAASSSLLRLSLRVVLVTLAVLLGLLALLLVTLRVALSQSEALAPRIEAVLEARIGAPVSIGQVSLSLARNDLRFLLEDLRIDTPQGDPLAAVERVHLRLDGLASLRHWAPIFSDARMAGLEFHLYQTPGTTWGWPAPARLPLGMAPQPDIDLALIDAWAGLLLRQRLWVDNSRVLLHGREQTVLLHAPSLVLDGDERRTRLSGELNVVEDPDQEAAALPAITMAAEMQPGARGLSDFSAALQMNMQLDHLVVLAALFRPEQMPYLEQAGGQVQLWGRWREGRLEDARLAVDMPELTLRRDVEYAVLRNIQASGQWQRSGEGGEAWLSGNAESVEWAQPEGISDGPALPYHWYLAHAPGRWELRTSAFELASLAAWREYALLPESLTRVLQTLAPRGQVQGLRLGQREGRWGVDAALTNVAVDPWQQAPGGGPLDAWVQARDLRGRVTFSSAGNSELYFPQLFETPMQLGHAEGVVEWVYDGPRTMISGRELKVDWDGARIEGGFGLITGQQRGQFGLDLAFENVDAVERPLGQWLPLGAFEPALREWLQNDIGGRVPKGALKMSLPFGERGSAPPFSATLALLVREGYLPIADGWPLLEDVDGRLIWQGGELKAQVRSAQSQGVQLSEGAVQLDEDNVLRLSGQLHSDGASLLRFLKATPEAGGLPLDELSAEGVVEGSLAAVVPLEHPEGLSLDINVVPSLEVVRYQPLPLSLRQVEGEVNWQQSGEQRALLGNLQGRWQGGGIRADFDEDQQRVQLSGDVDSAALRALAGMPDTAREVLRGRTTWEGVVDWGDGPTLTLQSQLVGLTSQLPEPFDKRAEQSWPLRVRADVSRSRGEVRIADLLAMRLALREPEGLAGTVALGSVAPLVDWPQQPGWKIDASLGHIDPLAWQQAVSPLFDSGADGLTTPGELPTLEAVLRTSCLRYRDECLGAMTASGSSEADRAQLQINGELLSGRVSYQPREARPLDVVVSYLAADRLLDLPSEEAASEASSREVPAPGSWVDEITTEYAVPAAIPDWLASVPNGRLRLAELSMGDGLYGPLTAYWQTSAQGLSIAPVGLTLGQLSARGELHWEGNPVTSRTRADLTIQGGDLGTALERLGQPVAMRSRTTNVAAELAWAGAPWQFALARAGGELSTDIRDGRFVMLDSAPARLVGLLNFDNILRRLRFDFSDVTGQGTAFDRVHGTADVAQGQLLLRGPLQIDAPATTFTLTGNVNLLQRELDQRLGVTLPVSQSLPIAAIAVGAPIVGGALFIADQLFGDALAQATTIHYRVRGPWTSPQVTLEGPQ